MGFDFLTEVPLSSLGHPNAQGYDEVAPGLWVKGEQFTLTLNLGPVRGVQREGSSYFLFYASPNVIPHRITQQGDQKWRAGEKEVISEAIDLLLKVFGQDSEMAQSLTTGGDIFEPPETLSETQKSPKMTILRPRYNVSFRHPTSQLESMRFGATYGPISRFVFFPEYLLQEASRVDLFFALVEETRHDIDPRVHVTGEVAVDVRNAIEFAAAQTRHQALQTLEDRGMIPASWSNRSLDYVRQDIAWALKQFAPPG